MFTLFALRGRSNCRLYFVYVQSILYAGLLACALPSLCAHPRPTLYPASYRPYFIHTATPTDSIHTSPLAAPWLASLSCGQPSPTGGSGPTTSHPTHGGSGERGRTLPHAHPHIHPLLPHIPDRWIWAHYFAPYAWWLGKQGVRGEGYRRDTLTPSLGDQATLLALPHSSNPHVINQPSPSPPTHTPPSPLLPAPQIHLHQ